MSLRQQGLAPSVRAPANLCRSFLQLSACAANFSYFLHWNHQAHCRVSLRGCRHASRRILAFRWSRCWLAQSRTFILDKHLSKRIFAPALGTVHLNYEQWSNFLQVTARSGAAWLDSLVQQARLVVSLLYYCLIHSCLLDRPIPRSSDKGLKVSGARGNFNWRAAMTYLITSSFVKFIFSLTPNVLVSLKINVSCPWL